MPVHYAKIVVDVIEHDHQDIGFFERTGLQGQAQNKTQHQNGFKASGRFKSNPLFVPYIYGWTMSHKPLKKRTADVAINTADPALNETRFQRMEVDC
jgi:hypothetical protein